MSQTPRQNHTLPLPAHVQRFEGPGWLMEKWLRLNDSPVGGAKDVLPGIS